MPRWASWSATLVAVHCLCCGLALASEHGGKDGQATCGVGKVAFMVELDSAAAADKPADVAVRITRPGKPPLPVAFSSKGKFTFWEPEQELETACEETFASVAGDSVVVLLAKEAKPGNPRAAAFIYRLARHQVDGMTADLGPLSKSANATIRRSGLCFASADTSTLPGCYREKCGKVQGVGIVKLDDGTFDEWICVEPTATGLKAATDPELTWKHLDEKLHPYFATRADFEKAFGWDRATHKYRIRTLTHAILEDSRTCLLPSQAGSNPRAVDGWMCQAPAGRGK